MKEKRYLTIIDYAEKNKISRQTVYNMIKDGRIRTKKLGSQQLIEINA